MAFRLAVYGVAAALLCVGARAQTAKNASPQASPASSLDVNARPVVVPVAVRDKHGTFIKDLQKSDVSLSVDDKPQTIRYFDRDHDVPLTLGLLVDTGPSQRNVLDDEREGSRAFLDSLLTPSPGAKAGVHAFVLQFAHEIELLQDVTDQRPALNKALKELGTQGPAFHNTDPGDTRDEEGRRVQRGGTALYDSLYLASDEVLRKQKGRRVLVVLTDGVDNGSKESIEDALEAAQRADTMVYAIYFKGEERRSGGFGNPGSGGGSRRGGSGWPGGGGYPGGSNRYPGSGSPPGGQTPGDEPTRKPHIDGKRVLERICGETGGRVFALSNKLTVGDAYMQIVEELRSQYRLEFVPDEAAATPRYHRLELSLNGSGKGRNLEVQTREGYYVSNVPE